MPTVRITNGRKRLYRVFSPIFYICFAWIVSKVRLFKLISFVINGDKACWLTLFNDFVWIDNASLSWKIINITKCPLYCRFTKSW